MPRSISSLVGILISTSGGVEEDGPEGGRGGVGQRNLVVGLGEDGLG